MLAIFSSSSRYDGPMERKAFEGYDEPVKSDLDPEEALKLLLAVEPDEEAETPETD